MNLQIGTQIKYESWLKASNAPCKRRLQVMWDPIELRGTAVWVSGILVGFVVVVGILTVMVVSAQASQLLCEDIEND